MYVEVVQTNEEAVQTNEAEPKAKEPELCQIVTRAMCTQRKTADELRRLNSEIERLQKRKAEHEANNNKKKKCS